MYVAVDKPRPPMPKPCTSRPIQTAREEAGHASISNMVDQPTTTTASYATIDSWQPIALASAPWTRLPATDPRQKPPTVFHMIWSRTPWSELIGSPLSLMVWLCSRLPLIISWVAGELHPIAEPITTPLRPAATSRRYRETALS